MKATQRRANLTSESGQAFVEYTLVLVVIVAITLGVFYQFNSAFRSFAQSYFGDYLTCLLEAGELPSLGGSGGSCEADFQPFNFENGRPLIAGNKGSSGGSGQGGTSQTAKPAAGSGRGREGEQVKGATGATDGGGSAGVSTGSSSFFENRGRPQQVRAAKVVAPSAGGEEGPDPFAKARNSKINNNYASPDALKPLAMEYSITRDSELERDEEKRKPIAMARSADADLKKKKLKLEIDRKPAQLAIGDGEGFSFSDFLRILLIAAILIGILFFLGTQVLNFSKSLEK